MPGGSVPIVTAVTTRTRQAVQEWDAELIAAPAADFAEGPLWDDRDGGLWWTDIPGSAVHRLDVGSGEDEVIPVDRTVGALAPRTAGGFAVASCDGFGFLEGGRVELIAPLNADDPAMRMNDGKCDAAGRFYAATMAFDPSTREGALYRLDADHSSHLMVDGVGIGNGLAWSSGGETLFYIDTVTRGVDAFDVDVATGDLSNRRRVVSIDERDGDPDGMCLDDEGALWVALWGGGQVRRYSVAGELLGVVAVPVSNVTCAAFGGSEYDELFISTAAPHHSGSTASEPLGGALFRIRPGVTGPPPHHYGG